MYLRYYGVKKVMETEVDSLPYALTRGNSCLLILKTTLLNAVVKYLTVLSPWLRCLKKHKAFQQKSCGISFKKEKHTF